MLFLSYVMILVCDTVGTDVHRFEEENLFISHPHHDIKVARYIERVRARLETKNDAEYVVYSFGCAVDLTELDPPWR